MKGDTMGRAKEEWMKQDEPSGFQCSYCMSAIPNDSVANYFDNGEECSNCHNSFTKDD